MTILIRPWGLYLLLLLTLQAEPETTRIDFYYGIAQGNYLIGDLKGATRGVEQMLKLAPDHVPALTLYARILLDQNDPEQALKLAEYAVKLEPDNLENRLLKALVLGNLNRREEAIQILEKAIQSTPVSGKHHRVASKLLGLFLMAEGDLDKAAEVFNQSYINNPETAQGNQVLAGEAYLQKIQRALARNDFKTAIDTIDQALEKLQDLSGEAFFQQRTELSMLRARILTRIGSTDEAIEMLEAITRQQPDKLEVKITLAALYVSTENWNALQEVLPAIASNPKSRDIALYFEGRIALDNGRVGSARETFGRGLRILSAASGKLRASMEFYQGVCLLQLDRIEEGDTKIIQSLDSGFRPETEKEAILASQTLLRNQQTQRAITILEALALNQLTQSAEAWNLLGRAHQANNSTALALSAFNQSLSIQPEQAQVLALRGSLLRTLGDFEGAMNDIERAIDLAPDNPALTYSLALLHLQIGNLKDASQWIKKSAKKLPENPGIQLLHALLAFNINDYRKAHHSLESYFHQVPKQSNESAFYLEYTLIAQSDKDLAIETLKQRIETSDASPLLRNFFDYVNGALDRKTLLDAAGQAETPDTAQKQLCEAAYWLAQHENICSRPEKAKELLKLAVQIGLPDYPEYQFAQWQLRIVSSEK